MWRSMFLAVGVFLVILGVEFLGVERVILKNRGGSPAQVVSGETAVGPTREIVPPPWAPWSLMSSGAIVCLYSFTIPSRMKG